MASVLVPRLEQAAQSSDVGWHTGVIQSWDEITGLNTVEIAGTVFNNVLVLSTGAPQAYVPGDVVIVLRMRTQYFIMGKVREPGYGAGERIASDRVPHWQQIWSDSYTQAEAPGPEVTVYIGSSRRALVIHSFEAVVSGDVVITQWGRIDQAVQITGASSRPPGTAVTNAWLKGVGGIESTVSATTLVTAADGLEQGQNTFSCLYRSDRSPNQTTSINNRVLTVIPF
ncbi:hypothetical protein BJF85_16760 [Saccharomonospora sp. CUA-673]|nr:hypothetical protein BJF85_16760 [Saccharomonospora sp. CUA-673]